MRMKFLRLVLALSAMSLPMFAWAQEVKLVVPDTAVQKQTIIVINSATAKPQYIRPSFDRKGTYILKDTFQLVGKRILIATGHGLQRLFFKPGSKTTLTARKSKVSSKTEWTYDGYGKDAYLLADSMRTAYALDRYFSKVGKNTETLCGYDSKLKQLDTYHDQFLAQAKALKDPDMHNTFVPKAEYQYLLLKASLIKLYDKEHGIDFSEDKAFQALLDKIDVNDPVVESYDLVPLFLKGKISAQYTDQPAKWVCEFVKVTNQYVSNTTIKDKMEQMAVQYLTAYLKGEELEQTWEVLKPQLSQRVVNAYAPSILSLVAIKSGVMAHDNEFCDVAGNIHRFSEFKGKVLYVDIWATWCGPCKMEIPYLAKVVEHYKGNDNVKIISISVDNNKKAWENKIAADKPAWPQYIANKEQYAQISKDWGIMGIPRFILINKDGTIYSGDAERPSNPNIISTIDKLLK